MARRIVSADSHMIEPANLWVERIDNRFKDRAPRAVTNQGQARRYFMPKACVRFRSRRSRLPAGTARNTPST